MHIIRARWFGMMGLVLILSIRSASSENRAEHNLLQNLLRDYNTNVRPVRHPSESVEVAIGVAMKQIVDLKWHDFQLMWNPAEYSNITDVHIAPENIWRPDITLYNDIREVENQEALLPTGAHSDGSVYWSFPALLKSTCELKVDYFPWDQQTCELQFGSWTHDMAEIDVTNKSLSGDITYFTRNGEWEVIGFPNRRNVIYYECCRNPYPDITFYLIIRRRPLYYLFNLILPCMFITATTILVFYLPADSGEKISLSVTVLLALTVFLLLVAETLPTQSDSVPLLAQYFGATIMMLAISTSLTVMVLNVHHRGAFGYPVPALVRLVVLEWLARMLRLGKLVQRGQKRQLANTKAVPYETEGPSSPTDTGTIFWTDRQPHVLHLNCSTELRITKLGDQKPEAPVTYRIETNSLKHMADALFNIQLLLKQISDTLFQTHRSQADDEECRNSWMLVAMVIDRLLLFVFTLLTIVVSSVLLLNHPTYGYKHANQPLDTLD